MTQAHTTQARCGSWPLPTGHYRGHFQWQIPRTGFSHSFVVCICRACCDVIRESVGNESETCGGAHRAEAEAEGKAGRS